MSETNATTTHRPGQRHEITVEIIGTRPDGTPELATCLDGFPYQQVGSPADYLDLTSRRD